MAITSIQTEFAGQVGVQPRLVRIISTDDFATVTAAGYLDNVSLQGFIINPTDFIFMNYDDGAEFGIFTPSISSGVITLSAYVGQGDVTLPVTAGNFANFDGTTGTIEDLGYLPSDAAKTTVVMANAATVANNLATFADIAGTVKDAGARIIANTTAAYAGGGTSNTFTAAGLTVNAKGTAVIRASTNSVSITKALPGTNTLAITFSADPGAATTVDYIYVTAALA